MTLEKEDGMAGKKPERRFVQPNKERGGYDVTKPGAKRASVITGHLHCG